MWDWLSSPRNQKTLTWIGVSLGGAFLFFVLKIYPFLPNENKVEQPSTKTVPKPTEVVSQPRSTHEITPKPPIPPPNCQPLKMNISEDKEKFVCVERDGLLSLGDSYKGITDTAMCSKTKNPRTVIFHFEATSCGNYELEATYASPVKPEVRSMDLYIDNVLQKKDVLSDATGWEVKTTTEFGWFMDKPGSHTLELRSQRPIPHIQSLAIIPAKNGKTYRKLELR